MQRRRALVVAATVAASLTLAGGAAAANLGLLRADHDPVGNLSVTDLVPAAQARPTTTVDRQPAPSWDDDNGEQHEEQEDVDDD